MPGAYQSILNSKKEIYVIFCKYSKTDFDKCFDSIGGTAFHNCRFFDERLHANLNVSGNDCILAHSLVDSGLSCFG